MTRSKHHSTKLAHGGPPDPELGQGAAAAGPQPLPGLAVAVLPARTAVPAAAARLPGLDGLRAVAVVAVLLYHLGLPHVAGAGFLGVDVFFTISGFIITALLLHEYSRTGRLDFLAFYQRRARRLLPPTFVMVAVVATLSPLLAPQAVQRLGSDIPAAALYVSNWWQIFSEQSYFENFDNPALLQHLWSLSVEEQYYIVWPLCVLAVLRVTGRRWLALVSLAGAVASTAWMAWLYEFHINGGDPSRVYLGTDTHLMGLLLGSALACVFDPWLPAGRRWLVVAPGSTARPWVGALGAAALLGVVAMVGGLHDAEPLVYRGGLLLAAALSAAVLVAAVQPGTWLQRGLAWPWVQWAGTRSFSLYLWHWPIFVWLRPVGDSTPELLAVSVLRLLLTVLGAELSYQLVERGQYPYKHRGLTGTPGARPPARWKPRAVVLAGGLVGAVSTALVVAGPAHPVLGARAYALSDALSDALPDANIQTQARPLEALTVAPAELLAEGAPGERGMHPVVWYRDARGPTWAPPAPAPAAGAGGCVNVIGDSVMLGARDHLARTMAGVRVDAEVGRQGSRAPKLLQEFRDRATLCNSVVVHLGNNGYLAESHYRDMLKQLEDRQVVVLVNIHANRPWAAANNSMIGRVSHGFDNIRIIDWYAISQGRPEFFAADGVHLTGAGIQAIAREIRRAVGLDDEPGRPHRAAQPRRAAAAGSPTQTPAAPALADPEPAPPKPTNTDG